AYCPFQFAAVKRKEAVQTVGQRDELEALVAQGPVAQRADRHLSPGQASGHDIRTDLKEGGEALADRVALPPAFAAQFCRSGVPLLPITVENAEHEHTRQASDTAAGGALREQPLQLFLTAVGQAALPQPEEHQGAERGERRKTAIGRAQPTRGL